MSFFVWNARNKNRARNRIFYYDYMFNMCVEGKLKRINMFHFDRLKKNFVYNNNNFESNFIHGVVLFFATVAKCTHADIS